MNILLPIWIAAFLPKKLQDKQIALAWARKPDEEILRAYKDATDWLGVLKGGMYIKSIVDDCNDALDNRIIPEMKRRGLRYDN